MRRFGVWAGNAEIVGEYVYGDSYIEGVIDADSIGEDTAEGDSYKEGTRVAKSLGKGEGRGEGEKAAEGDSYAIVDIETLILVVGDAFALIHRNNNGNTLSIISSILSCI